LLHLQNGDATNSVGKERFPADVIMVYRCSPTSRACLGAFKKKGHQQGTAL
jgi:hypothetical protein